MLNLIGFGAIVWITKKLVESGIDSHFDDQEIGLNMEFQYHYHRQQLEQENERYHQYLTILKYWARYEKLILFRQQFIAELARCLQRSSHPDTEVLKFVDSLIQDSDEDHHRPSVYWVMGILARIGQVVDSNPGHELGPVIFQMMEGNERLDSRNVLLEYITLFFSYEKMWVKVQASLFQLDCRGKCLERQYFRALEDVLESSKH